MSRSHSREKEPIEDARKVFITNIDGSRSEETVEAELRRLFDRFGTINKLNVKKNKNGLYYFAFLQFENPDTAGVAIKELDQYELFGKRMRVRQDRQNQGCFHCKKTGHYARQCPENKEGRPTGGNEFENRPRFNPRDDRNRQYRPRQEHRGRDYDRYRHQRDYREVNERDRRGPEYRRYRRSPTPRSHSRSRSYTRRRDYSSESRSRSYDRRYGHENHKRRYYERENRGRQRGRQRYRDEPRRRRESSYSRSHSRSSGR